MNNLIENSSINTLLTIMDNINNGAIIVDDNYNIMYANKTSKVLLNNEYNNQAVSKLLNDGKVNFSLKRALSGKTSEPTTYLIDKPVIQHIRVSISPFDQKIRLPEKQLALIILNDITEYVFMQSQRSDFLANASHELKTPVASLLGYIETLEGHAKNDAKAREKFLSIMHTQAERMQHLINDLLSLLKIEQIEHIVPDEAFDLTQSIETALETVSPLALKRNIKINFHNHEPKFVTGDYDEIVQVIINLVHNAIKISEENTSIDITICRQNECKSDFGTDKNRVSTRIIVPIYEPKTSHYCLRIKDNGPGFAEGHIPRIGERFYRIAGDLNSQEKGTGLGLAIVKHIIMRHRGGLDLKTKLGSGSEFCISLPINS
jgi:two-component system phosphate regulon sensor histidine kinase PhoR